MVVVWLDHAAASLKQFGKFFDALCKTFVPILLGLTALHICYKGIQVTNHGGVLV